MKLVLVEWIDSCATSEADHPEEVHGPIPMASAGILIEETKRYIALTQDWNLLGSLRHSLVIPKTCIIGIQKFEPRKLNAPFKRMEWNAKRKVKSTK